MKKLLAAAMSLVMALGTAIIPMENSDHIAVNTVIEADASQSSTYKKAVTEILSGVNKKWSDFEKILYIHDYLVTNCEYDLSFSRFSAYDAIVNKKAVCQGYSEAFKDLLNRLDIPCEVVMSYKLNHAWNAVKLNGKWYYVDVTWDDPIYDQLGKVNHDYFLKSDKYFHNDNNPNLVDNHNANDYKFTGKLKTSYFNSTKFDNQFNDNTTSFVYYNGYWYGKFGKQGTSGYNCSIKAYKASDNGLKYVKTIKNLTDKWHSWDNKNATWIGNFSGLSIIGNTLYYSTPQNIKALNLDTKKEKVIYTLSSSEKNYGYIYGFYIDKNNVLKYQLSKEPNANGKIKSISVFKQVTMSAPKASTASNSVKLSWSKVGGAKGYIIYMNGKRIGKTSSTSFTVSKLKSGTTYKFSVKPYRTSGENVIYGNMSKTLTTSTK